MAPLADRREKAAQAQRGGQGYTLLELMAVVAIIALLATIALPVYQGHLQTSREGALISGIATMEVFQEDHRLRTGAYLREAADVAAIAAVIGWRPKADHGVAYRIAPGAGGTYHVTATAPDGARVCLRLPEKTRC